jgi:glutathione peroxidase
MAKLKQLLLVVTIIVLALTAYVIVVNINAVNMTNRQKITKAFYPAIMWLTNMVGAKKAIASNIDIKPNASIYNLTMLAIDSTTFNFSNLTGKKILIVNTASDCGYTGQLDELEKLYQQYKNQVEIIAFPANDFKQQEKGTNNDIAAFCKKNYGVTFPIMSKSVVINTAAQNAVFKWLCTPSQNGWNSKVPTWNFCKYLINQQGQLTHFFESAISPLSTEVINAITN